MKRIVVGAVLAAATTAYAEPVAIVARGENVDVLVASGAMRRVVYVAPTDHPELLTLVRGASGAAGLEAQLTPFAGRESKLVAVQLTTTIVDARASSQQTTTYLVRATPTGALDVVCTLPAAARTALLACGSGWHRDVVIALEASTDGVTRFTTTSRDYSDFSAAGGDGTCRDSTPVEYQPTVARYELGLDGACSLQP